MAGYIWAYANKNLFQSLIISLYSLNKMHWYWVYVKKRPVISFSKKINSKYTGENHFLVKKIYRPTHKFKFNSIVRWFFFSVYNFDYESDSIVYHWLYNNHNNKQAFHNL